MSTTESGLAASVVVRRPSFVLDVDVAVAPGQVLAVIESPELDHQYNAAQTDLEHKRRNLERSRELFAKGARLNWRAPRRCASRWRPMGVSSLRLSLRMTSRARGS